ncbi:hypothetical protein SETIT_8G155100v2 [Setaria italica]|uniref:Uncharacterized protein n=1 Tax=Setaria italica TaxID=4555 RepID=A0A368S8C4_SETIT|nr:hypothetical protein SETIT_8G155100v2 [Setaria italica]
MIRLESIPVYVGAENGIKFAGDLGRCCRLLSEEARCSGADPISTTKLWWNYGEQTLVLLNQNYGDWRIG